MIPRCLIPTCKLQNCFFEVSEFIQHLEKYHKTISLKLVSKMTPLGLEYNDKEICPEGLTVVNVPLVIEYDGIHFAFMVSRRNKRHYFWFYFLEDGIFSSDRQFHIELTLIPNDNGRASERQSYGKIVYPVTAPVDEILKQSSGRLYYVGDKGLIANFMENISYWFLFSLTELERKENVISPPGPCHSGYSNEGMKGDVDIQKDSTGEILEEPIKKVLNEQIENEAVLKEHIEADEILKENIGTAGEIPVDQIKSEKILNEHVDIEEIPDKQIVTEDILNAEIERKEMLIKPIVEISKTMERNKAVENKRPVESIQNATESTGNSSVGSTVRNRIILYSEKCKIDFDIKVSGRVNLIFTAEVNEGVSEKEEGALVEGKKMAAQCKAALTRVTSEPTVSKKENDNAYTVDVFKPPSLSTAAENNACDEEFSFALSTDDFPALEFFRSSPIYYDGPERFFPSWQRAADCDKEACTKKIYKEIGYLIN